LASCTFCSSFWWGNTGFTSADLLELEYFSFSFKKFKVIIPKANGNGTFGKTISTPLVEEPEVGATETCLSIGAFDTRFEAESVLNYVKTKFARTMLGVLKITQAKTLHQNLILTGISQ
jgi:hypothetical protein